MSPSSLTSNSILVAACTDPEENVDTVEKDPILEIFQKNCETVKAYEAAFCAEKIDYDKFYADSAMVKGTTMGAKNSMYVKDRKEAHKAMWEEYDFKMSDPLNLLPGANLKTKEIDGSVSMYFELTVIRTETQKSVTISMYEKYDFNEDGKIVYLQYYGDLTAAFQSLEE
jgi:hypothetical protein